MTVFIRPFRRLLGRPLAKSYFHTTPWVARKVTHTFKLADIGEGITECEIVKWSIKPETIVQSFDPLCEVQSDKASVEITSPFDGVVKQLLVQEGEIAKVGSGLCLIEVEEDGVGGSEASVSQPPAKEPAQQPLRPSPEAPPLSEVRPTDVPQPPTRRLHPLDPNNVSDVNMSNSDRVFAAPSVRHFARQNGVDLGVLVPGSGKDGRIEKRDVEAYLSAGTSAQSSSVSPEHQQREDVVVDLGRTRYGMWKAMVKSLEIPHFGYTTTLDITALHEMLPTVNTHIPSHFLPESSRSSSPTLLSVNPSALYPAPNLTPVSDSQAYSKLTYLPILLKTLSKAMMEWPLFRSSITPSSSQSDPAAKPTLTIRPNTDISIALSTPTGLYTPTLQSVNSQSIYGLATQLKHLSHLGRQTPSGLTTKEMPKRGGTITVSNVGAIGAGDSAMPVLVPGGGVAIVALGRAKWVWDVDRRAEGERRLKLGVSWSGDHRIVEGAELAAFVECWRGYVEAPERLIGEGV